MGIPKAGIPTEEIPKAGIPRAGTLPETEIPKPGIPKSGIPKLGIPKTPIIQTPLRLPVMLSNGHFFRVSIGEGAAPPPRKVGRGVGKILKGAQKREFPNLVVSNLLVCKFYAEALERSFVDLCLRSFALICVFLRPTALRTTAFGNCRHKRGLKRKF